MYLFTFLECNFLMEVIRIRMIGFKILKYFSLIFWLSLSQPSLFFEKFNCWLVFIIVWSVVRVYSQYIRSFLPRCPYLDFLPDVFFTETVICVVFCDLKMEYLWTATCHNSAEVFTLVVFQKNFSFMCICEFGKKKFFFANVCVQIFHIVYEM